MTFVFVGFFNDNFGLKFINVFVLFTVYKSIFGAVVFKHYINFSDRKSVV